MEDDDDHIYDNCGKIMLMVVDNVRDDAYVYIHFCIQ